jgi:outer membrane usher protein FimD/PapC
MVAHHSFTAQYDRSKPKTLLGPVTKLEWINPHARFFVDVKEADGKVINWAVELGPPAMLMRNGWTRTSLAIGSSVTVNGSLAKDGSHLLNASTVTLSDGKRVFAGSSGDEAPK